MPVVSPIASAFLFGAAAFQAAPSIPVLAMPVLVVAPEAVIDEVVVVGSRTAHAPAMTPPVRSRDVDLGGIIAGLIGGAKPVAADELTTEQRIAAENAARR